MDVERFQRWHNEYPVKVVYHESKGRHMIATKDLVQGDVLLSDFPYCWVVDETAKDFVCQNCFLEMNPHNTNVALAPDGSQPEFIKCPDCQQTGYCSEYCLAADYCQHSLDECALFRNLEINEYSPVIVTEIKLLIRTLSRKWLEAQIAENEGREEQAEGGEQKKFSNDNGLRYEDYSSLITNKASFPANTLESLDYWICDYIRRLTEWVGGREEKNSELLDILLRNRCNAFYIQGRTFDEKTSGETRGCGVYVRNSFFNHSCAPNVNYWVVDNSLKVECTSAGTCPAGDELTISYIDSSLSLQERRAKLLESYMFHCDCTLCVRQDREQAEGKVVESENDENLPENTSSSLDLENAAMSDNETETENETENETQESEEVQTETSQEQSEPEQSEETYTESERETGSQENLLSLEKLSISSETEETTDIHSSTENSEIVNETHP
eukprot:TRINITY_DN7630_c0_g1_i1.p1 TRINITY_DN7630_c0_g1~~TRINITY_DN7630_c0_g1_i1.p1  ORF type:complete len:477 (+),score=92.97 TRINITY_DN7630_c0_g1_i1:100-1431(+)